MNLEAQIQCFDLIEQLVKDGHRFSTLPISPKRVEAILTLKEAVTPEEVERLRIVAGCANA
jgi:hypothetical protein